MWEQYKAALAAFVLPVFLLGCEQPTSPLDPVTQRPLDRGTMDRFYQPMVESGAAHDMSLADIHFAPHTTELNSLGIRRLDHLRISLDRYGGTVRYETLSTDKDEIEAKLCSIERYLTDTGLDMGRVKVAAMMSGGRGLSAVDALRARKQAREAGKSASARSGSE